MQQAGEAGSRSGAPVKKAGAKPNGDTAAYMDDRPKQNAFTYPGYAQPGISSQQSVKEALKQKAAERELQAEKAMRELLGEGPVQFWHSRWTFHHCMVISTLNVLCCDSVTQSV